MFKYDVSIRSIEQFLSDRVIHIYEHVFMIVIYTFDKSLAIV
jgi:hypothetical protein